MADNSTLPVDGGTETFANDDIGGIKYPRAKLSLGADGSATDAVGGAGSVSAAVQRMTLASDDPAVALLTTMDADTSTLAALSRAEDAAHSDGHTGIMALAVRKDTSSTGIGANGDYVPLAVDASGRVYVTAPLLEALIDSGALIVKLDPTTVNANGRAAEADSAPVALSDEDFASLQAIETATEAAVGGLSVFRSLDLDESEEQAKATPGKLYKLRMTNFATSTRYVKIYNATAANVTVGTTTPIDTIVLPAASSGDACVVTENFGGKGLTFDTALTLAATTALADNDTGAPGANEVVVSAYYE